MEALDTSILVRVLVYDVAAEAEKAEKLLADTSKKFFVADMVFFETVYVLEKGYAWPRRAIATALAAMFIEKGNVYCNKSLIYQVLEDYVKHPKLSFGDCYLAWKVRMEETLPLWTLDKKLAKQMKMAELVK